MASTPPAAADLAHHHASVRATRSRRIAPKSKNSYLAKIVVFLMWLFDKAPSLLSVSFRESLARQIAANKKAAKVWIKEFCLVNDPQPKDFPLVETFSGDDLAAYLDARKNENICPSYLQGLKSGVRYLFVIFGKRALYDSYGTDLSDFMAGAKKDLAQARQDGTGKVREGKEPMQFGLYDFFGQYLLCNKDHIDAVFAHLFMTLSWNLVCRSKNTETIRLSHMRWLGDALGIVFAKQKNDQEGDNTDYRSVYANPLRPQICPILALGIYFICVGFSQSGGNDLFPGGKDSQASRYGQIMRRVYKDVAVAGELKNRGIKVEELGTHSVRKGAATFCASGSTDCPSITAIQLRAGWKLEGVTGRYLRFAAAGDQHVGRTVCGLNPMSPEFAILPPFFSNRTADVPHAITVCFPHAPSTLTEILEFCLASLIYHEAYLRRNLPTNHPVFASPIWRSEFKDKLRPIVECRVSKLGDRIQATGSLFAP